MKEKTVLVTGASRGLGRAIAEAFAGNGWNALGVARTSCDVPGVQMIQLDVCDEAAVTEFIGSIEQLDVVINNAGIARINPLIETPTQELRDILEINVVAAFVVMREAARRMVQQGGGQIINIASDAAVRGIGRMAPYVASKHALLGLGRSAAQELRGQGLRVTAYCPGPIATEILGPISENAKALRPEDIAKTIVHLASLPPDMEVHEILVESMNMDMP